MLAGKINLGHPSVNSAALIVLVALTLVVIPHFFHLPKWLSLLCLGLIAWRAGFEFGLVTLPGKSALLLVTIGLVVGVSMEYNATVGKDSGSALLIGLLCLKLFETQTFRDVSMLSNIAIFSLVVNFLYDQSILVAIVTLVALVFLFSGVIGYGHRHPRPHRHPRRRGWAKPEALAFPGADHERMHFILAGKMLLQAFPFAIALFLLFPRIDGSLWGLPEDAFSGSTGLTEEMSPGLISQLSNNDDIAFRVKFDTPMPAAAQLYWRGPVMGHFDGFTWSAAAKKEPMTDPMDYSAFDQVARYTITLQPHNRYWLFALDSPVDLPENSFLSAENQVLSQARVNQVQRYQLVSKTHYLLPAEANTLSGYLQVPQQSSPRSRQLVRTLSVPNDPEATLAAVLNYFSEHGFFYTRNAPRLSQQPIDEFLFDSKRGYCEHFASSFTVLMRLAGVPSRVVTGYLGGEVNPLDDVLAVRQSDAHAWSEVYLGPNKGWVRIDPTAYIPPSNIESPEDQRRLSSGAVQPFVAAEQTWLAQGLRQAGYAWDLVNNQWSQWVLDYNSRQQQAFFAALGFPELTWQGLTQGMLLAVGMLAALLAAGIFARPFQRRQRVQAYYARFVKRFGKYGIRKSGSEGASDFSQRASAEFPEKRSQIQEISDLYNQLRYGEGGNIDLLKEKVKAFRL
jgi:transglutaminase-like putative cysteine protease